jgi:hypothetical protein
VEVEVKFQVGLLQVEAQWVQWAPAFQRGVLEVVEVEVVPLRLWVYVFLSK